MQYSLRLELKQYPTLSEINHIPETQDFDMEKVLYLM